MQNSFTGTETIQKMAIALLIAVAAISVIGLFSLGAADEVRQAAIASINGLQLM